MVNNSKFPKVHPREDQLTTVYLKPIILTLPCCTATALFLLLLFTVLLLLLVPLGGVALESDATSRGTLLVLLFFAVLLLFFLLAAAQRPGYEREACVCYVRCRYPCSTLMRTHTTAHTLVAFLNLLPGICVYVSGGGAFSKKYLLQAGDAAGCAGCPNQSACASGAGCTRSSPG
jgi:hypothetical protein